MHPQVDSWLPDRLWLAIASGIVLAMDIDRRTLLYAFGIASVSPLLRAQAAESRKVVVAKPGENRFAFSTAAERKRTQCKTTSEESGGTVSIFVLKEPPRSGGFLHVHHREDEWYYVLSGEFLFHAGGEEPTLTAGGSIWLPRDIPHAYANLTTAEGELILVCQPGGFEKFFDELAKLPDEMNATQMKEVLAKFGMELLGPPLLSSSRQQH